MHSGSKIFDEPVATKTYILLGDTIYELLVRNGNMLFLHNGIRVYYDEPTYGPAISREQAMDEYPEYFI